jgi:Fe-S-cluster containining protein
MEQQRNARAERFSFACQRCSRCCYHKGIRVNPYEVARLARRCGQTTTDFRKVSTRDGGGTLLAQRENGACVFLGPEGCTVHADRPEVCRLYPLGRFRQADGIEGFTHLERHPESAGEFGNSGTIADYLEAQDAGSFIKAADQYFSWLCEAARALGGAPDLNPSTVPGGETALTAELLDMDAAIRHHCAVQGIEEPTDIEDRKELHLAILYEELEQYSRTKEATDAA